MIEASTFTMRNTMVKGSGVSMLLIWVKEGWRNEDTPLGGLRSRSYDTRTSSAVNGVPSWNLTFGCSLNV